MSAVPRSIFARTGSAKLKQVNDEPFHREGDRVLAGTAVGPPRNGRERWLAPRRPGAPSPRRRGAGERGRSPRPARPEDMARSPGPPADRAPDRRAAERAP